MCFQTNLFAARGPRASPPALGNHPGGLGLPALPGGPPPPGTGPTRTRAVSVAHRGTCPTLVLYLLKRNNPKSKASPYFKSLKGVRGPVF